MSAGSGSSISRRGEIVQIVQPVGSTDQSWRSAWIGSRWAALRAG